MTHPTAQPRKRRLAWQQQGGGRAPQAVRRMEGQGARQAARRRQGQPWQPSLRWCSSTCQAPSCCLPQASGRGASCRAAGHCMANPAARSSCNQNSKVLPHRRHCSRPDRYPPLACSRRGGIPPAQGCRPRLPAAAAPAAAGGGAAGCGRLRPIGNHPGRGVSTRLRDRCSCGACALRGARCCRARCHAGRQQGRGSGRRRQRSWPPQRRLLRVCGGPPAQEQLRPGEHWHQCLLPGSTAWLCMHLEAAAQGMSLPCCCCCWF